MIRLYFSAAGMRRIVLDAPSAPCRLPQEVQRSTHTRTGRISRAPKAG